MVWGFDWIKKNSSTILLILQSLFSLFLWKNSQEKFGEFSRRMDSQQLEIKRELDKINNSNLPSKEEIDQSKKEKISRVVDSDLPNCLVQPLDNELSDSLVNLRSFTNRIVGRIRDGSIVNHHSFVINESEKDGNKKLTVIPKSFRSEEERIVDRERNFFSCSYQECSLQTMSLEEKFCFKHSDNWVVQEEEKSFSLEDYFQEKR